MGTEGVSPVPKERPDGSEPTPFEKMEELTRRLVRVPKSSLDMKRKSERRQLRHK